MTTPSFARRTATVDAHAHLYDAGANRYGIFARKDPEGTPPTAERTLDSARMFAEELDPTSGIREQPRP
jgi:predicted TIM-barrel fold metal-dependent hydrolase